MKRLALLLAAALLALALPATAAETPPAAAAPAPAVVSPAGAPVTPIDLGIKPLQACWAVQGTSCPAHSGSRTCSDACGYQVTCQCILDTTWIWWCGVEC